MCAVALLEEAIDQSTKGNNSKLINLDYFSLLHLSERDIEYDQNYLDTIKAVVTIENLS